LLEESAEYSLNDFWFFVDQDFDGMRGHAEDAKTWMTPGYSFENLLVSEAVLEALLKAEYRCNDVNGLKDIENIKTAFADFTLSYKRTLRFANLAAFYAASEDVKVNPHDEVVTPKISVLFPNVILRLTDGEILLKMGKGAPLEEAKVLAKDVDFQKLDAVASWRGKFLLSAFVAFLDYLRKDRGSKNPKQFVKKAKMEFNPRTDPIRTLTSIAELPESLSDFLQTIPSH
jgi:hypothetical protein